MWKQLKKRYVLDGSTALVKKHQKNSRVQRFTPRNPKSAYSQLNKERLKRLLKKNKVITSVRKNLSDLEKKSLFFQLISLMKSGKIKKRGKIIRNFLKLTNESGLHLSMEPENDQIFLNRG